MLKGYLSVPSSDAEKQPWFLNEKNQSPLLIQELGWLARLNLWFMSPRQKEKSTRKMLRSRTRGIKLICTLLFCTASIFFIHRFIDNYIQFGEHIHNHFIYNINYTNSLLALPQETVSDLFKSIPSSDHIKHYFTKYASSDLAGSPTDKNLAEWTRDTWKNFGVTDTTIETYWPLLNYPSKTRLAIVQGPSLYEANVSTSFHAYSGNGNVTGPIIYVNYGRLTDFQFLLARGISFKGTIALLRNGVINKGLKLKMAQDFGCIGAVLYTDPDDTNTTVIG